MVPCSVLSFCSPVVERRVILHSLQSIAALHSHAHCDSVACAPAALGPVSLAAHTIVKQIIDFAMAIFGCFSTVAQSLVATCLGKVGL